MKIEGKVTNIFTPILIFWHNSHSYSILHTYIADT